MANECFGEFSYDGHMIDFRLSSHDLSRPELIAIGEVLVFMMELDEGGGSL